MKSTSAWLRSGRALYTLLVPLLINDLANGLPQQQQQPQMQSSLNVSLPGLSERASNMNSRYLSAANTASLAAATVAASNNPTSGLSSSASISSNANSGHNHGRDFATHQANTQSAPTSANGNSNVQAQGQASQVPQFNSAQPTVSLSPGTPVMSSTFTYNPATNQFLPSELSAGSLGQFFVSTNQQQPQQQPQQQQSVAAFIGGSNPYLPNPPFALSPFAQRPTGQVAYPILVNQRASSVFNRRNGFVGQSPSSARNPIGVTYAVNQDDDGTFYPQQVGSSLNSLTSLSNNDLLSGTFGPLENPYGPLNGYQLPYGSNQQRLIDYSQTQSQVSAQPSSLSPVTILPSSTTSFNTAFSGPPQGSGTNNDYKSDQCVAADNRHGTCYQASECIKRGGTPMGKCGSSMNSNEISGSSYVCCLFDITCGQFVAERFVYFRNPNYPNTFDQNRMCRARIGKLDRGVCQFRLDLLRFDVAKPTNGNCSHDMFVVSGQNENYVIPKICGLNDGQHYFVGVDESGVITLHMMMMGYYRRSFEILVTQIPCKSDYSAPAHCLQYYMGTHGTIKSFNYDDEHLLAQSSSNFAELMNQQIDNNGLSISGPTAPYGLHFNANQQSNMGQLQQRQHHPQSHNLLAATNRYGMGFNSDFYGGYPNDLDYTMCIRKESGFCSITYQLSRGELGLQPFAVGQSSLFANGLGANENLTSGSLGSWHPVSTECRDDYLLIGGVRLCSGSTNGQLAYQPSPIDASIQFAQNGTVLSSAGVNQASLQYQQLQNQYNLLMQQLSRVQQLQQQQSNNYTSVANNSGLQQSQLQAGGNPSSQNNNNLEQQQTAIVQQAMMIQQQLSQLSLMNGNTNYLNQQTNTGNGRLPNEGQFSDLQGAIITDTTSGPFILRFVSNTARNARGFHIDYRQNPCK